MRDSGYSRWETARIANTRLTGKSVRLQDWGARVDDRFWMFWTCLPTLVCTAISNDEFYKHGGCGIEHRTTWRCNTVDNKWFTNTWRRTAVDEFWSRSQLTWWACSNSSWALLHWIFVASQSSSITIMIASFFETRHRIWYLTIVIPICTSLWRMESRLAKRWWWRERMREMTWKRRKSTAAIVPRDMRLKKLQLVIDEQSPMRIKPDS